MDSSTDLRRRLGDELVEALHALGVRLAAAIELRGAGYPGYRPSAYRLAATDGRVLKGRRFASAAEAERAEYVARCLGPRVVSAPLMRSGAALVSEWLDGEPPTHAPALLRRCGALQAAVHAQVVPDDCPYRPRATMERRWAILEQCAGDLVGSGALDALEARRALEIACRDAPSACTIAFILGDFCAENAIVSRSGEVRFIDHGTLSIDACEYDLARTWYRWPLPAAQRTAFLDGYAARRSAESFDAHFLYWAITVLIGGARFRRRLHVDGAVEPLRRLHALLEA
jgi:aminoglycoside phosphotransferase